MNLSYKMHFGQEVNSVIGISVAHEFALLVYCPTVPREKIHLDLFGKKLKELRKESHLTQAELAEKLGLESLQVSRYENGKVTPSVEAVAAIATVFNVSADHLIFDSAPRTNLKVTSTPVIDRLQAVGLGAEDERALLVIVDAMEAKSKLKTLAGSLK